MILSLAFFAETRTEAETQAIAWADAEPHFESATVVDAYPSFPRVNPDVLDRDPSAGDA